MPASNRLEDTTAERASRPKGCSGGDAVAALLDGAGKEINDFSQGKSILFGRSGSDIRTAPGLFKARGHRIHADVSDELLGEV